MILSEQDWHARFSLQARWTRDLRNYLYHRANISASARVLDVGCGTGVLISELLNISPGQVHGLDLNRAYLKLAQMQAYRAHLTLADAHVLPFQNHAFDVCLCHYLLLWVQDPAMVISEMVRVTQPGGLVLALAEPDYGGRIDHPPELVQIGHLQQKALRHQGANPETGRLLPGLFASAGLIDIESGILGAQWIKPPTQAEWESEWEIIQSDFQQIPLNDPTSQDLTVLKTTDAAAWSRGDRVLFVPTFFTWGKVTE